MFRFVFGALVHALELKVSIVNMTDTAPLCQKPTVLIDN